MSKSLWAGAASGGGLGQGGLRPLQPKSYQGFTLDRHLLSFWLLPQLGAGPAAGGWGRAAEAGGSAEGGCLQGLAGFLGSRWWVWGGLAQHLRAGWGPGPRSPALLVSASGVLGCEEAATEQTNRACEDRKQLRTTRPRLPKSSEWREGRRRQG